MFNEKLRFAIDNYNRLWIDGSEDDMFITLERPLFPVEYDNRREVVIDKNDAQYYSELFNNQQRKPKKRRATRRSVKPKSTTNQDYYQICHDALLKILSFPISEDDLKIKTIGDILKYDLTKFVQYIYGEQYGPYCNYLQTTILPCIMNRFRYGVGRCTVNNNRFTMLAAMLPPNELIEVGKARRENYIIQSFADNDTIVQMAEQLQRDEISISHHSVKHIAFAVYNNIVSVARIDLAAFNHRMNTARKRVNESSSSLQRFIKYNKNNSVRLERAIKAYDDFIETHADQKALIDNIKQLFDYQVVEGQFISFLNRYLMRMPYDKRSLELGTCKVALSSLLESVNTCSYRIALEEPFWSPNQYVSIDLVIYYWLFHKEDSNMTIYFSDTDSMCQYDADPDFVRSIFTGGDIPSGRSVIQLTDCSIKSIAYICDAIYQNNGRHVIGFQFHNMEYIDIVSQKCATRRVVDAKELRSLLEVIDKINELETEVRYCRRRIRDYDAILNQYKLELNNYRSQLSKAKKAYEEAIKEHHEIMTDISCGIIKLEGIFGIHFS